ncbi:MAG: hypothetical protein GQ574_08765 [Crocinitomix sp.]|nr:hypothetical protein [Crocinitomix sp.]
MERVDIWLTLFGAVVGAAIGFGASAGVVWNQKRNRKKYVAEKLNNLVGKYSVALKDGKKLKDTVLIDRGENESLKTEATIINFISGGKEYGKTKTIGIIAFHEDNFIIGTGVYQFTTKGLENRSGKSDITIMKDNNNKITIHVLNSYYNIFEHEVITEQLIWTKFEET